MVHITNHQLAQVLSQWLQLVLVLPDCVFSAVFVEDRLEIVQVDGLVRRRSEKLRSVRGEAHTFYRLSVLVDGH